MNHNKEETLRSLRPNRRETPLFAASIERQALSRARHGGDYAGALEEHQRLVLIRGENSRLCPILCPL